MGCSPGALVRAAPKLVRQAAAAAAAGGFSWFAAWLEAFARAIGDGASPVPPTWVTVPEIAAGLAPALADPELGIELSRVLHAEEDYGWRRALHVGESVTAQTRIASIRGRGDVEFLTLITALTDEGGEEVALATSVLIVRGGST
jgi:hypothetical protein